MVHQLQLDMAATPLCQARQAADTCTRKCSASCFGKDVSKPKMYCNQKHYHHQQPTQILVGAHGDSCTPFKVCLAVKQGGKLELTLAA
jgi:hypothetical protein